MSRLSLQRSQCVTLLSAALLSATPLSLCWAQARPSRPSRASPRPAQQPAADTLKPSVADTAGPLKASTFAGLTFRSIGPAVASGRIGDIAIHRSQKSVWYVAPHSGGVWKSQNAGTTWTPVFDSQGSYSIGALALDPKNPLVVWVGTGENNSQRSVGYGDGVYKSSDGGKSWTNVGLRSSAHIGRIAIDPRNSDVVYVAAGIAMVSRRRPGGVQDQRRRQDLEPVAQAGERMDRSLPG